MFQWQRWFWLAVDGELGPRVRRSLTTIVRLALVASLLLDGRQVVHVLLNLGMWRAHEIIDPLVKSFQHVSVVRPAHR
jgi:hypothetical protein